MTRIVVTLAKTRAGLWRARAEALIEGVPMHIDSTPKAYPEWAAEEAVIELRSEAARLDRQRAETVSFKTPEGS